MFSKDRATQLDALLRSIRAFLTFPHRLHVLYTASSAEFELGYDRLRIWHKGVHWVSEEGQFGQTMKNLMKEIDHGPGRYLMFLVDDMMFIRPFTAAKLMKSLAEDDKILAVSLRLGESITYCYTANIQSPPPDFSKGYRWAWKKASSGYWNYPMSLDAHIFRTSDFAQLLPRLNFSGPNMLEAILAGQPLNRPDLVCEQNPTVINVAANRVQSYFQNRSGAMSAELLNESLLAGLAIDVRPFVGRIVNSCHIEEDLPLIEDERASQPDGFERIERDGRAYLRIDLRKIPTFILNLSDDTNKRLLMQEQMLELGMNYEFVSAFRADPSWVGVALSQLKATRLSRARPPFLVLEDDCVFNEHFRAVIEVPAEADCLYLGASLFGIEKPGQISWGKYNNTLWERYDRDYLRVTNMLSSHALLYLKADFQAKVIESRLEALTNRHLPYMCDIGLALLQPTHTALLMERSMCRQVNRDATAGNLAELLPGNEAVNGKMIDGKIIEQSKQKPEKPKAQHTNPQQLVMVSHKYRFIYFQIGKNASSTIKAELSKPRYECETCRFHTIDDSLVNDYFKFAFLRDPVSRMVSAYQEVSLRHELNDSTVQSRPFMQMQDSAERFEAFLDEVTREKWDTHVRTQSDLSGHLPMDFYGRVEFFAADLKTIFEKLRMGSCPDLPRQRSRSGRKADFGYERFNLDHRQLNQVQIDRIRALYEDDVDLVQAFCPAPPMYTGDAIARHSSQARWLAIVNREKLSPIELFSRVNDQHEECMVYVFGDRGFYAELTTVARAMIYAWVNGYRLLLDSSGSTWAYELGWADYFKPFCGSSADVAAEKIVAHCDFDQPQDRATFNRLLAFTPEEIVFGQLKIKGFQAILAFFTAMIFRPTADCQAEVDRLTDSLDLPKTDDAGTSDATGDATYDAIHIRRGDKVGDEDIFYPVEAYLNRLGKLHPGQTLFVMSDDATAVEEVRDCLRRPKGSVRVVSLVRPESRGFDAGKLRRGEPFMGESTVMADDRLHREYIRGNTRKLIAETLIAARASRFCSTWRSNVGQVISFLRSNSSECQLIEPPANTVSEQPAHGLLDGHWADLTLRQEIAERRAQYVRLNGSFTDCVSYSFSDGDLIDQMAGLARAMVYAMSRERQLLLDSVNLPANYGSDWNVLFQPLLADSSTVEPARIKERISLHDEQGELLLANLLVEQLDFGVIPLHGFRSILGFFLQMTLWPSRKCQDRIKELLKDLPLEVGYHAFHFSRDTRHSTAQATVPTSPCFDQLKHLPDHHSACVLTEDDQVFATASRQLASLNRKTRAVRLRISSGDGPLGRDLRLLAELTLILRSKRFVSAIDSRLGQAAWLMHPRQEGCALLDQGQNTAAPTPALAKDGYYLGELQLRDGKLYEFELPADFKELESLQELIFKGQNGGVARKGGFFQLPLQQGQSALTFSGADVRFISLLRPAAFGPDQVLLAPRKPAIYTVDLWQWILTKLEVKSVLDVGCGEGHAAAFFRDHGCDVLGVDGSVLAERDSVIPGLHQRHDFTVGPFVPPGSWDLAWSCEFVEHVEERFSHNFLATFACARKYVLMTFAPPGQQGWHHVNCQNQDYWVEKMHRLGFALDKDLTQQAREATRDGHFKSKGLVFVRSSSGPGQPIALPASQSVPKPDTAATPGSFKPVLPVNSMLITQRDQHEFFLFLDIFVHPSRNKIVAVLPWYNEDWNPAQEGVDFEQVFLLYRGKRIRGRYIPHRLDSWEPCALLDFEDPLLEKWLNSSATISFQIEVGPHVQKFQLSTAPPPAYGVLMSLVIKDENRWVRHFLEYYLNCLKVDHVLVYDNRSSDRESLLKLLQPYQAAGKVTFIPWDFRWRNLAQPCKMIAQPQQEAHSLNRFANSRWIGFLDVDEFLRVPDTTLPEFLAPFETDCIDGLSFGLRWFQYDGALQFDEIRDVPLTFFQAHRSSLGRSRQKLLVAPARIRFLRIHWLEEGGRELPIDDTDIFFHHYCQRDYRFKNKTAKETWRDDYMLRFADRLSLGAAQDTTLKARTAKPTKPKT